MKNKIMMKYYEMLCVLPGTLSEEEVAASVEKVKESIEKHGGKDLKAYDLGKSRLAYPVKHIRYGYFRIFYFQAEPEKVKELDGKLRIVKELLRVIIRMAKPGAEKEEKQTNLTPQSHVVVDRSEREEEKPRRELPVVEKQASKAEPEKSEKANEEPTEEKVVKEKSSKKVKDEEDKEEEPSISIEDIDKKLDEILQKDLDKA